MTEQGIVYAAVLVPGEPDCDLLRGEKRLTEKEISRVAWDFLLNHGKIDIRHSKLAVAAVVESYLLPEEMTVLIEGKDVILPRGTWIMGCKVQDAKVLKEIKAGILNGFSVTAVPAAPVRPCPIRRPKM